MKIPTSQKCAILRAAAVIPCLVASIEVAKRVDFSFPGGLLASTALVLLLLGAYLFVSPYWPSNNAKEN